MGNVYESMETGELDAAIAQLEKEAEDLKAKGLKLDMARGKPSPEQTDLSRPMLDLVNSSTDLMDGNIQVNNYGGPDGLPSARKLAAEYLGVDPANVIVNGSSSLNLMHDTVSHAYTHGIGGSKPWGEQGHVKFLCPAPGYDRHFKVTAYYGIENVPVAMHEDGPDMDEVRRLVESDPTVKGIWCVPKYENPMGITYSDEVVRAFANLHPAAPDFRIFWDNAYGVHHLYDDHQDNLIEILAECQRAGNPDMVYKFASTSKITFPGSGIAALATSANNLKDIKEQLKHQTIGHDKVNQLRHVRYFKNLDGIKAHMRKQADIIRPKFECVEDTFETELGGLGIGTWTKPNGGYFISFDSLPGCAREIVDKAKKAGVTLTGAGATWPYHRDPQDSNIRIAPTYPPLDDLKIAAKLFTVCVKMVSAEHLLQLDATKEK